jgi:hypothetical protein
VVRTWHFNGPATMQAKAEYIRENGYGGIMVWELAQDHFNAQNQYTPQSLLPVIKSIINPPFAALNGGTLTIDFANSGGAVHLSQSAGSYLVSAPAGSPSFPTASVNTIVINGTSGNDTLHLDSSVSAPTTFNGTAGSDALHVNGGTFSFGADAALGGGNLSLTVNTGASVVFNATQHLAAVTINSGATATLASNGNRALVIKGLSVNGTGRIDLTNNHLIVDYTDPAAVAQVRALLVSGRGAGAWNGAGIMTSSASGVPGTGLGYADASALFSTFPATFAGEPIDSTSVVVSYTYEGDATLDRRVDVADLGILASHWQQSPRVFAQGDFDYNGTVDVNDLGILASNWQQVQAASSSPTIRAARRPQYSR